MSDTQTQVVDPQIPEVDPQKPVLVDPVTAKPSADTEPQTFSKDYVAELRRENATWRTKHGDVQKQLADLQTAHDALAKENASTKEQMAQARVRGTFTEIASEYGAIYPDLIFEKVKLDTIEHDEQGNVVKESISKQLDAVRESYPALFKQAVTPKVDLGVKGQTAGSFDPETATPEQFAEYYKQNIAR